MAKMRAQARDAAQRAWFVTVPLAVLAILLTTGIGMVAEDPAGKWPQALIFFALFLAAEAAALHFTVRRQGFTLVVNEIPFVLALFFLPPVTVVIVRVAAALVVQLYRRAPVVKLWFNLANHAAAAALATVVVFALGGAGADAGPRTWLVLAAGVLASLWTTLAMVIAVLVLVQGRGNPAEFARMVTVSHIVAGVNVTVGLLVLLVLKQNQWAVLLLIGLAAVVVMVYRAYAEFQRQHVRFTEMYELTRAIGETRYDGTMPDVLLGRVRDLMQCEYATLWLPAQGRYPEVLLSARVEDRGLLDVSVTPEPVRRRAVETGRTVAVGPGFDEDQGLRERGVKDVIVVPLRSGQAVIGSLEVANRISDVSYFGAGDVRVLETVAAHTAAAVENARLVDRLRFDAHHDALTGLPNRARITEALEASVAIRAPGEVVAVLLFDVDALRDVNESLGHAAGDKLLAEVARRLRVLAPTGALVGRLGGDEFVVTLRVESAEAAVALATELRGQLLDPMVFGTLTLDVNTAVGVVVHPDHGTEPAVLLQRADLATHTAKSLPSGLQLFNPGLESRSVRRLGLAGDLRRALDAEELEIYFQPKVLLGDRRLVGVECLARWEHPAHGSVSPEDFVAVAEHTGQLPRLTEAVLKEGLRRCQEWADAGRPLSVAVNLSSRTLIDPDFPAKVDELLAEYGVAADRVTFEITEAGMVGETDRPMPTLRRLHEMGVRLAVDDFGTGYSSLSYLRRLPVDEVKIDQAFVQGMATDSGDLAIVRAVVDLARHFGLTVVAEGVESELTLDLLEEIGCDIGQGYLFSRPLPYERLEAWFAAQTEPEPTPTGEVRRLRAVP